MNKFKPKIRVFGVGGSGSNTVSRMKKHQIKGIDLVSINTDIQDLRKKKADIKLEIGYETTQGLGTGMDISLAREAVEESQEKIKELLEDLDMVFLTGGLGGGTATGALPLIAEMAQEMGVLTIVVVTQPFTFEGAQRKKLATIGLKNLRPHADTLLVIPNDKLLNLEEDLGVREAFQRCDEILKRAIQSISDLLIASGQINIDFADLKSVMEDAGPAMFGMGKAHGKDRISKAVEEALNCPLLGFSISGAQGALFNIASRGDLEVGEFKEASEKIKEKLKPKADLVFGTSIDKKLKSGEVRITLIATGVKK